MPIHSRVVRALVVVLILAMPAAARGQTGTLHKHGPLVAKPLPVGTLPTAGPGAPPGIERASRVASPHALGLERAKLATARVGSSLPMRPQPLPASQPGAPRIVERDAGATPDAIPSGGSTSHTADGPVPGTIHRVGQQPVTAPPRWTDRLRFSWPGSKK